ncbi:MAG: cobalamin-dependent protein [Spirochaetota bacterium]|nr:cobalamin-dependent protein [Spirochaetota bacterium]
MNKKIRVLLCKIGQDSHDQGVKVIAAALRDAGMEVIYTGPWQTLDSVANMALQEDVDIIGVSCLNYEHLLIPKLMSVLEEKLQGGIPLIAGGIIPPDDATSLKEAGVREIFPPGSNTEDIVKVVETIVRN